MIKIHPKSAGLVEGCYWLNPRTGTKIKILNPHVHPIGRLPGAELITVFVDSKDGGVYAMLTADLLSSAYEPIAPVYYVKIFGKTEKETIRYKLKLKDRENPIDAAVSFLDEHYRGDFYGFPGATYPKKINSYSGVPLSGGVIGQLERIFPDA